MRAFPVEEVEKGDTLMLAGDFGEVTVQRVDRTRDRDGDVFWVRWARPTAFYPDGRPCTKGMLLGSLKPLRPGAFVDVVRRQTRRDDR